MKKLDTRPNLPSPDDFYEHLIDAHRGLTNEQSHCLNAALVLLLSNHIGDPDVLYDALEQARSTALDGMEPQPPLA